MRPHGDAPGDAPEGFTIGNEFAEVRVERVATRNGIRLRISSPRDGSAIDLCPLQLEAIAGCDAARLDALVSDHTSRGDEAAGETDDD